MEDDNDDVENQKSKGQDNSDYYKNMASAKYIRPIMVTEGVNFDAMSNFDKIKFYLSLVVQMIGLIIFSIRTDRLWNRSYLRNHWKHYFGMLMITVLAWIPQLLDTGSQLIYGSSCIPNFDLQTATIVAIIGLLYYILGISVCLSGVLPYLREKIGTANTLRFWEYFLTIAWQAQTLGFWCLTKTESVFIEEIKIIPDWVTTSVGIFLVIFGISSKASAIYMTGINTYYWYDMCTNIPNAYFIEGGIYKLCGSPTYTLGRGTSFGVALHYRSVPVLIAAVVDVVTINLFNIWIEQPFVRKTYSSPSE